MLATSGLVHLSIWIGLGSSETDKLFGEMVYLAGLSVNGLSRTIQQVNIENKQQSRCCGNMKVIFGEFGSERRRVGRRWSSRGCRFRQIGTTFELVYK